MANLSAQNQMWRHPSNSFALSGYAPSLPGTSCCFSRFFLHVLRAVTLSKYIKVVFYWDQPFQPKPDLVKKLRFPNRTFFQPFLVDMQLWLNIVISRLPELRLPRLARWRKVDLLLRLSQEMLEELVPLHCESVDESEYFKTTCLWLYQARNLSHIKVLKMVV